MTEVMIKFHLPLGAAFFEGTRLVVQLGNGVHLSTAVPAWIEAVQSIDLCLLLDVEGSPPDELDETPISQIHQTPSNG